MREFQAIYLIVALVGIAIWFLATIAGIIGKDES